MNKRIPLKPPPPPERRENSTRAEPNPTTDQGRAVAAWPIEALVRVRLQREWGRWLSAWANFRAGGDTASVHSLRTSARRLDSLLVMLAEYEPTSLTGLRERLARLLKALGEVRDLDVACARLKSASAELSGSQRIALGALQRFLRSTRQEEQEGLARLLSPRLIQQLDNRLQPLLRQPHRPATRASPAVMRAAEPLIRHSYRKLHRAAKGLGARTTINEYHRLRSRVRRVRYTLEPLVPLFGKPAVSMLKTLHQLQEALGTQHDAYMLQRRLSKLATVADLPLPQTTMFEMGRLTERCSVATADAVPQIQHQYRKLRGTRWPLLKRALRRARSGSTAVARA